ncbi:B3 domain-containing protein At4g01580-like [Vigna radiata var. radiata]|uniref:B3 domain-containing protein At4g01580-like n=1 Tax=Vigna radiata var. radiata TaxID=3916 RepID=A0A3Q0FC61_VIGRR|nr:B3 domain-containing protein At4g01580-like [Vigna radiata var. radiata]
MASETQRAPMLPISFFKVILRTNLQTVKIPNMFTAKYGDGLQNPFFMNLPNQTQWKVIWENESGEILLKEGWNEFTEHHSLDHGDFVFFEYVGTDQINVNICKQSGVEMDYPHEEENPEQIGGERSVQRTSSLKQPNETRAREVACNFISCNPFFTVVITPSHVMEYRMNVPDLEGIIEKKEYVVLQRGETSWRKRMLFNNARYRFGAGLG